MSGGSVSFVDFTDENWKGDEGIATPEHSLDLGCGVRLVLPRPAPSTGLLTAYRLGLG
jgi:hypothetical protein